MSRHVWPLLLFGLGAAALAAAPGNLTMTRKAELRNLVMQDCGSCHGLTMKGGLGRPLLPANLKGLPDETVVNIILDGVGGTPMPPWRGLLTEPEALWIAQSLKQGIDR
jgi:cytochrome c55X